MAEMSLDEEDDTTHYTLKLPYQGGEEFGMSRKRCTRSERASGAKNGDEGEVDGDLGGWSWGWS
jgi:hypothetical protein